MVSYSHNKPPADDVASEGNLEQRSNRQTEIKMYFLTLRASLKPYFTMTQHFLSACPA